MTSRTFEKPLWCMDLNTGAFINWWFFDVPYTEIPHLERLLQFYLYEIGHEPKVTNGLIKYGESLAKYFNARGHFAYFILCACKIAGLAMAETDRELPGPDGQSKIIANIIMNLFILRPYRRKGLGT